MRYPVLEGAASVVPSIDFETYSEAGFEAVPLPDPPFLKIRGSGAGGKGGIVAVGAARYAEHPSTRVLSLAYDLKDGRGVQLWTPDKPPPTNLLDHVAAGGLIAAWNVGFEFYVWNFVCARRIGWPRLRLSQCRCDMAKARRYSLPGALAKAAAVMGTPSKDPNGDRLLRKLSRPHSPTKNRPAVRWDERSARADFLALYEYNKQDVVAEDAVAYRVPDLEGVELAVWQLDQVINVRGVRVDVETLRAARKAVAACVQNARAELKHITGGRVSSEGEIANIVAWLNDQGVALHSLDKAQVAKTLSGEIPAAARRVLEIRQDVGSANVKKLEAIALQVSSDGRLRDQYVYSGAATGRWTSGGVQLQNITSSGPSASCCASCGGLFGGHGDACPRCGSRDVSALSEWGPDAVEQVISDIRAGAVSVFWSDPIAAICGILRGLFIPAEGHKFICADFSAIEAVAAACLARCQWRIDVFSTHGKIYEASASKATGIPFKEILAYKEQHGTHHPARKGVGKIRELAGGYGGWVGAWKNFGADKYFENDEAIKADVLKWREESPEIVEMWGGQFRWVGPGKWDYRQELFGLEGCAIAAVQSPGRRYYHNDVSYRYDAEHDALLCYLPSGRPLYYHRPRLVPTVDKLNRGQCVQLTFEGYNTNPNKGPVGWVRMETYGGRLFENVVQAASRDIQAEAMLRAEAAGYRVVMHTHDEICAEVPDSADYTVDRLVDIMTERPAWASWWPIRADGWEGYRYRKD